MAGRQPKEGIDFSSWTVDIFDNDTKIDKLLDGQGPAGFLIYFYLCQKAYGSKGYFFAWSYDDAATTARKIGGGVGSEAVKQTVALCLQIGLFDNRLFEGEGVITSKEIQRMFWHVARERTYRKVIPEYWLLKKAECKGIEFESPKSNYAPSKLNYEPSKLNYEVEKERKGKNSKVKESKEKKQPAALSLSQLTFKEAFPNKAIDCDIPANIDLQKLIEEIKLSTWLQKQDNISLKSCIKLYEKIIAGAYRNYKTEADSVLDPLIQARENRLRRQNNETNV